MGYIDFVYISTTANPVGVRERDFCPIENIDRQYPVLIVKGDKKGQRSEKLYLEAVMKDLFGDGQTTTKESTTARKFIESNSCRRLQDYKDFKRRSLFVQL